MNDLEKLRKEIKELDRFLWDMLTKLTLKREPWQKNELYVQKRDEFNIKKDLLEKCESGTL